MDDFPRLPGCWPGQLPTTGNLEKSSLPTTQTFLATSFPVMPSHDLRQSFETNKDSLSLPSLSLHTTDTVLRLLLIHC